MMTKHIIKPKRIGYSNSVLIVNGPHSVLVDTGVKGHLHQFEKLFKKNKLKPEDIKLIILTHTHYDHTGNLHGLKKLTGAKVLVHINEAENLKKGYMPIPTGRRFYTRFISDLGQKFMPKFASPEPFTPDLINNDEFDLSPYGIDGKVISTPGHSAGSQAVVLGKTLISGDNFMNMFYGVVFPHFAENPQLLIQSWERIFNMGIEEIYPGHGTKLGRKRALSAFKKWKKKLEAGSTHEQKKL
jgi:hydroxyacylglutathione hydrolase